MTYAYTSAPEHTATFALTWLHNLGRWGLRWPLLDMNVSESAIEVLIEGGLARHATAPYGPVVVITDAGEAWLAEQLKA